MTDIRTAAVIGAGTMGAGIASHLANAGVSVILLDVSSPGGDDRNAVAQACVDRIRSAEPPSLMHRDFASRITVGNVDDDLDRLGTVDWIAEAVIERLDVKQQLYRAIDAVRRPDSIVSSNTSTIPLRLLADGTPDSFQRDFCITHFFNPVRYMRLLELVVGPQTRPELVDDLTKFCDRRLGKGVVRCNDTPGFLGNRVGVFWLETAIRTAISMGLTVEEADAILGRAIGFPKTGVFALYDLIGLDLMLDVVHSLRSALPADDLFHSVSAEVPQIRQLVAAGNTGNKSGGGFYRTVPAAGNAAAAAPQREAMDLGTSEYRPAAKPELSAVEATARGGLRVLLERDDLHGRFAWQVLSKTLRYAAQLVPDTTADPTAVDEAMKLGFNWTWGPLEMIDQLGTAWFAQRLDADGQPVPTLLKIADGRPLYRIESGRRECLESSGDYRIISRPPGVVRLSDVTAVSQPILQNDSASLWDVGDGVGCVEFHTKANALDPHSMELVNKAVDYVQENLSALVVHNDAPHFSMGVNLRFVHDAAQRAAWSEIEQMLADFQTTCLKMKYAPFPVIGAPGGMALGGGFEVLLHCDALQAHANTVCGLVESRVGLIPSGGGCKEMLSRWHRRTGDAANRKTPEEAVFEIIGPGTTAASPLEAAPLGMWRRQDAWTMNRDRVLPAAKERALNMIAGYRPPEDVTIAAAGEAGRTRLEQVLEKYDARGYLAPHDWTVARQLAWVLCGDNDQTELTEDELLRREREAFMRLVQTPETMARIAYTLDQGQPLRN